MPLPPPPKKKLEYLLGAAAPTFSNADLEREGDCSEVDVGYVVCTRKHRRDRSVSLRRRNNEQ